MNCSFKTATLIALSMCAAAAAAAFDVPPDFAAAALQVLTGQADLAPTLLAFGPLVRQLQGKHAETIQAMKAMAEHAEAEDRDLTPDEQTQFQELSAAAASLKTRIARAQELELSEAGLQAAAGTAGHPGSAVTIPPGARISVSENSDQDPNRGFATFGDYARAVMGAARASRNGVAMDQRLVPLAAAPSTYAGEGNAQDGGILVPPGFSTNIFTLSLTEDALLPMTDGMPIDGNSMSIPTDETTPWGTNGIRAYWQGEATVGTPTKPVLGEASYKLKKLLALVPVSSELLSDSSALNAYLPPKVADSIRWKANEAILFGATGGVPLGAFTGPSVVTVVKESGQAANTLLPLNLANMISRLPPGSYPRAVWMLNNDVLPALFTLNSNNQLYYLPYGGGGGAFQGNPYGTLLGLPIMVTQHAKSFSAQGDVLLADLKWYQSITKAEGVVTATSMHLYFDADAMAFRTTFRMDGAPKLKAAISPANGSATLSPFIQLGAR